jgi:hypothetical protein
MLSEGFVNGDVDLRFCFPSSLLEDAKKMGVSADISYFAHKVIDKKK